MDRGARGRGGDRGTGRLRRARCSAPAARARCVRPTRRCSVDLGQGHAKAPATARRAEPPKHKPKKKKPKVVYLQSPSPVTINPADPTQGGVGPYIDIKLTGCSKVMDGGVVPSRPDVFVQGSYIKSSSEYHVLIGLDEPGRRRACPAPRSRSPRTSPASRGSSRPRLPRTGAHICCAVQGGVGRRGGVLSMKRNLTIGSRVDRAGRAGDRRSARAARTPSTRDTSSTPATRR